MVKNLALLTVLAMVVGCAAPAAQRAAPQSPVFDLHVHLWNGEDSLQAYFEQQAEAGIEVAGIGAMWFGGPNQALAGSPAAIAAGNDAVVALAARHPQVIPIVTVHPYDGAAAITELERVAATGVTLLKLHPHTQGFDAQDPRVLTLVRRAGELGMVVMLDNANILPGDSEKLFDLALKAPDTKFVFAHLGGMNFRFWNILKAARTAEGLFGNNIYFDISAIVVLVAGSPVEEEFVWTVRNVGIDRVLLGSDYPQYSLEHAIRALESLPLNEEEKAGIRFGNAQALFGQLPRNSVDWEERPELGALFDNAGVEGTFVLHEIGSGRFIGHDRRRAETRFIPASTFKIPHVLIGLAEGAVESVDEVLPYGGQPQPFKSWEQDMSLRAATPRSNAAIFQELARRIGLNRMKAQVAALGYGNGEIGTVVDTFWLTGPLEISAIEQTRFLARLVRDELPFPASVQATTREVVLLESGDGWALHGKTGWENAPGSGVGWWVGWVRQGDRAYTFALNLDIKDVDDAGKRIALGRACLETIYATR